MKKVIFDFGYNHCLQGPSGLELLSNFGPYFTRIWPEYMTYATNPNQPKLCTDEKGNTYKVKSIVAPIGTTRTVVIDGLPRSSTVKGLGHAIYIDETDSLIQSMNIKDIVAPPVEIEKPKSKAPLVVGGAGLLAFLFMNK